jgi:hypothetical protein
VPKSIDARAALASVFLGLMGLCHDAHARGPDHEIACLRAAMDDLAATFKDAYPHGSRYRRRLAAIAKAKPGPVRRRQLLTLKRGALLANPLL